MIANQNQSLGPLFDYAKRIGAQEQLRTGLITLNSLAKLSEGTKRVFELLRDGKPRTAIEINIAAGSSESPALNGTRRARELRQYTDSLGRPLQLKLFRDKATSNIFYKLEVK